MFHLLQQAGSSTTGALGILLVAICALWFIGDLILWAMSIYRHLSTPKPLPLCSTSYIACSRKNR